MNVGRFYLLLAMIFFSAGSLGISVAAQGLPRTAALSGDPPVLGTPIIGEFVASADQQNINASVSISVTDDSGVATVILYYKIAGASSWKLMTMALVGGVYSTIIGPFSAIDNVSYFINATDTLGNFACSPADAPTSYYTVIIPPHSSPPPYLGPLIIIIAIGGGVAIVSIRSMKRKGT